MIFSEETQTSMQDNTLKSVDEKQDEGRVISVIYWTQTTLMDTWLFSVKRIRKISLFYTVTTNSKLVQKSQEIKLLKYFYSTHNYTHNRH